MGNVKLKVGDACPEFTLLDHNGEQFHFQTKDGNFKIVYFYPKDDTKVCTAEACSFRDWKDEIDPGIQIIGISGDSPASHLKFRAGHQLNFTLLSDPKGKVRKQFGAQSFFGLIPDRVTYLIDGSGKIRFVYQALLEGKAHAEKVDEQLREIMNEKE